MSSVLYTLRREIRKLLLEDLLWNKDEVIIKRRTDIWNDVAVAVAASGRGQCLVVGVASGSRSGAPEGSRLGLMEVTIPITLFELPDTGDGQPDMTQPDEDERWEATVMRLHGSPLGRSEHHYSLEFQRFEDVEDEQYVIRQTTFKTTLLLRPA